MGNRVGKESLVHLGASISSEKLDLKVIKLEKAGLTDATIANLVENLLKND